jgi:hypothetical protein
MAFDFYQLHVLRDTANGNTPVAAIPREVSDYLGCKQTLAYFSSQSLRHALEEHSDLDLMEFLCMPDMVRHGLWITDRKVRNKAVVIYHVPEARRYISALKVTGEGFEPYMCSFYRLRDRDYRAKLRRGDVLRPHLQP